MPEFELSMGNPNEVVSGVARKYGAESLRIKNHVVNYVGIANERIVIKAPQSTKSMGSLAVEAAALELLERSRQLTVPVPRLVEFSTDPAYLVATYLPGEILEAATLHKVSLENREALGHDIGAFVLSQAQRINIETARNEIPPMGEEDTWESLFTANISTFSSPAYPSTSKLAKQLYTQWVATCSVNGTDEQFVQGDLRLGNMVVSENTRLAGVFDFGRAGTGDASYEISPLINIDSTIMQGVINELQAANVDIDIDQIHLWDKMKKMLQLTSYITAGNYSEKPPLFLKRACRILAKHHPELDWSELNQPRGVDNIFEA